MVPIAKPRSHISSGVGRFEGSGGVRASSSSAAAYPPPQPHPICKKISPDFCVSHRPHWAAQGGPDPWTPLASYTAAHIPCSWVTVTPLPAIRTVDRYTDKVKDDDCNIAGKLVDLCLCTAVLCFSSVQFRPVIAPVG